MLDAKYVGLIVMALFSGTMLVHQWLSLYNRLDYTVVFYAGLLILSFSLMLVKK